MSELELELKLFETACFEGDLVAAKRFISANPLDDDDYCGVLNSSMFDCACRCGNLSIVDWVLKLNPKINYEHTFYVVCSWGYLRVARWMLKKAPTMDIPQHAFDYACLEGQLDVAKWLHSVKPSISNISNDNKYLCECSCANGHVKVAEWLFQLNYKAGLTRPDYRPDCRHDAVIRWLVLTRKMSLTCVA